MKFGLVQKNRFQSTDGAYSVVTKREFVDSQITLTDHESELIINFFGLSNIQVGNKSSNPELSRKSFKLYPTGETIFLNLVFPKKEKTELRLYLSKRAGFKPNGNEIWFLFLKNSDLWIGSSTEKAWRSESSIFKIDEYDQFYQDSLVEDNEIKITKLKQKDRFARDRNLALKRMDQVGFVCEYDNSHKLFTSRFNRKPYLEAHHLIPLGMQDAFSLKLDSLDNLTCLCPYCHRAVHHASEDITRTILRRLTNNRKITERYKLSTEELYALYAIEEID